MRKIALGLFAAALLAAPQLAHAGIDQNYAGFNVITRALSATGTFDDFTFTTTNPNQIFTGAINHQSIGGAQDFCVQVISPAGAVLCAGDDTITGGGNPVTTLDPSMTCVVPTPGTYRVRVSLYDGSCFDTAYGNFGGPTAFYRLNTYLSNQGAVNGTIQTAAGQSKNLIVTP